MVNLGTQVVNLSIWNQAVFQEQLCYLWKRIAANCEQIFGANSTWDLLTFTQELIISHVEVI